jgi:hypothetical protein
MVHCQVAQRYAFPLWLAEERSSGEHQARIQQLQLLNAFGQLSYYFVAVQINSCSNQLLLGLFGAKHLKAHLQARVDGQQPGKQLRADDALQLFMIHRQRQLMLCEQGAEGVALLNEGEGVDLALGKFFLGKHGLGLVRVLKNDVNNCQQLGRAAAGAGRVPVVMRARRHVNYCELLSRCHLLRRARWGVTFCDVRCRIPARRVARPLA